MLFSLHETTSSCQNTAMGRQVGTWGLQQRELPCTDEQSTGSTRRTKAVIGGQSHPLLLNQVGA